MKANKSFLILAVFAAVFLCVLAIPEFSFAQTQQVVKKDPKKARQAAEKGRNAFAKRDYRTALVNYSQAVELDPDNPDHHYWKGALHFQLDEHALAIPALEAASAKGYKDLLRIYEIRWRSYFAEKKLDLALADIEKAVVLAPNNIEFLQAQGDIYYGNGNYVGAIDAYRKVLAKDPNRNVLYMEITRAYVKLGDLAGQVAAAEEAVKRPTNALGEAYRILGEGYQRQRKFDEAIAAYQRAISANSNDFSNYQNLADLLRDQNRFTDAIAVYERAKSVFPNDGRVYTGVSALYSLADKKEQATQSALAGVRYAPNEYKAYTNLCRAYNDVNKAEMAIRECNNALKINANDGETLFYLARAHDLAQKENEATQYYKRAVTGLEEAARLNPDSAYGFYLLGNAYFANNQPAKAIEAYVKCLELSPRFGRARYNVGIIQLRQKNKTAALEQYNRLLEMDPDLAGKLKVEIDKS